MSNLVTLVLLGVPAALIVLGALVGYGVLCRGRGHSYGQLKVIELTERKAVDVVLAHDPIAVLGMPHVVYDEWRTGETKVVRRCRRCGAEQPPETRTCRTAVPT